MKLLPEFEKLTGIQAELSILPEVQARQKAVIEFTSGSGGVDAWVTSPHVEKRGFFKAGWYLDLRKLLNDPTMTAPDYDWDDIHPAGKVDVTQPDKSISALPIWLNNDLLFYRKDLFQQKGLKPPKTMAEMDECAQKLHNPPNMYGFVNRGQANASVPKWDWALYAMGGTFMTKDGKASINTPEAIKAMDWYAGMLRRFAPPGVLNFNWYECSAVFMQGIAAMYYDSVNFASPFEDKEKSKIAGKVGYIPLPAGPAGQFAIGGSNAVAISPQSKRQGPAWLFAQWSTSKTNAMKQLRAGVGMLRTSVWDNPEVRTMTKMPPDWVDAYHESLKIMGRTGVNPALPEIVSVTEFRDIVGVAIQKAIEGAKSSEVLAVAQKQFQELLDKTEK
jgi:multiple sugar transport system substrate-binding protein